VHSVHSGAAPGRRRAGAPTTAAVGARSRRAPRSDWTRSA